MFCKIKEINFLKSLFACTCLYMGIAAQAMELAPARNKEIETFLSTAQSHLSSGQENRAAGKGYCQQTIHYINQADDFLESLYSEEASFFFQEEGAGEVLTEDLEKVSYYIKPAEDYRQFGVWEIKSWYDLFLLNPQEATDILSYTLHKKVLKLLLFKYGKWKKYALYQTQEQEKDLFVLLRTLKIYKQEKGKITRAFQEYKDESGKKFWNKNKESLGGRRLLAGVKEKSRSYITAFCKTLKAQVKAEAFDKVEDLEEFKDFLNQTGMENLIEIIIEKHCVPCIEIPAIHYFQHSLYKVYLKSRFLGSLTKDGLGRPILDRSEYPIKMGKFVSYILNPREGLKEESFEKDRGQAQAHRILRKFSSMLVHSPESRVEIKKGLLRRRKGERASREPEKAPETAVNQLTLEEITNYINGPQQDTPKDPKKASSQAQKKKKNKKKSTKRLQCQEAAPVCPPKAQEKPLPVLHQEKGLGKKQKKKNKTGPQKKFSPSRENKTKKLPVDTIEQVLLLQKQKSGAKNEEKKDRPDNLSRSLNLENPTKEMPIIETDKSISEEAYKRSQDVPNDEMVLNPAVAEFMPPSLLQRQFYGGVWPSGWFFQTYRLYAWVDYADYDYWRSSCNRLAGENKILRAFFNSMVNTK